MRRTKTVGSLTVVAATLFALAVPSTAQAEGKEKAGRWMANIRVGVAANLGESFDGSRYCGGRYYFCYRRTQFVISPEIAVALDRDYNAYLGFIPMFQVGDGFSIINLP